MSNNSTLSMESKLAHIVTSATKDGKKKLKLIQVPNTFVHNQISPIRFSLKLDLE